MIKTPLEINAIKTMQHQSSCEVNYCKPCLSAKDALITAGDVPIQIPVLIKNAEYVQSNNLAMSFCRLYLTDDVTSKEISSATDTFFANWNDWKHYLKESEEITDFRSSAHPSDAAFKFSHDHQRFLVELQKLQDETNEKWVDRKAMEERLDKKIKIMAYDIAVDLNNAGFIIQQNNFSKLRKVTDVH